MNNIHKINKNIYITSNEEIKDGDWLIVNDEDVMQMKSSYDNDMSGEDIWVGDSLNGYATYKDNCKKIILTTDQSLDGVQSIDDEFLQWFVKNPSCEKVKLENHVLELGYNHYKIIIPKEENSIEAKQRAKNYMSLKGALDSHYVDFSNPNVDKITSASTTTIKETTFEEAADEYFKLSHSRLVNEQQKEYERELFIAGAKWMQEQMYSEEDMINFSEWRDKYIDGLFTNKHTTQELLQKWFEQFKNK